jgi:hypothetical protein
MAFNPEATALVALRLVLGVFFIRKIQGSSSPLTPNLVDQEPLAGSAGASSTRRK